MGQGRMLRWFIARVFDLCGHAGYMFHDLASRFLFAIQPGPAAKNVDVIVIGLGNAFPQKLAMTRHNVGAQLADRVARDTGDVGISTSAAGALYTTLEVAGRTVVVAKLQTSINLSGLALKRFAQAIRVESPSRLVVLYDDMDLPVGKLRLRNDGSSGGHNGIKDLQRHLGPDAPFLRMRLGIGRPASNAVAAHVLGTFVAPERAILDEQVFPAAIALLKQVVGAIDDPRAVQGLLTTVDTRRT